MHMIVTGGAGFIGSHFVRYILQTYPEDRVTVVDALTYAGNTENLASVAGNPRYRFVQADITDREAMTSVVKGADAIVHFAAESHVDRSITDPGLFLKTNIIGTETLLRVARSDKIRFHHVSTDEVFGALTPDAPAFTETTPYDPRSPYAASKAASDHLVRAYFHTYGLPITITNASNTYGPNMYPEKIIPLFIARLLEGKPVPVYGDGLQIRDWMHVADHVRGVDLALRRGTIGETYCLGSGNEVTNIALTRELLYLLQKTDALISYVPDRLGHDRRYAINTSKAEQHLGFKAEVPFKEGLAATVEWYKDNEDWVKRSLNRTSEQHLAV
jgi:dTDP-glucose 4,6-dehydratase